MKENLKIMRRYPLAGDTEEDATFVLDDDDEDVDEAPMSVPSAVPPVGSSAQIQTNLSSLIVRASAADQVSINCPTEYRGLWIPSRGVHCRPKRPRGDGPSTPSALFHFTFFFLKVLKSPDRTRVRVPTECDGRVSRLSTQRRQCDLYTATLRAHGPTVGSRL
jgi:hypothetical protein